MISNFKARAPTVLHRKPFEPVKPNRQLPLPDVTLASEIRAKDREVYDRQLMLREQEMEAARQQVSSAHVSQEFFWAIQWGAGFLAKCYLFLSSLCFSNFLVKG